MLQLDTKLDKLGFWFRVTSPTPGAFHGVYVAVGVGAQHASGAVDAVANADATWQFVPVGFRVLRVGFSRFGLAAVEDTPERPRPRASHRDVPPGVAVAFAEFGSRSSSSGVRSATYDREHEVFPQEQVGEPSVWLDPVAASSRDGLPSSDPGDPYPYPYPYPYPFQHSGPR